jgi:hypothetical protein
MAGRVTDRVLARSPSEGDDPPEYEPDEEPGDDWPEAEPEWFQALAWGPRAPVAPRQDMADLAETLEAAVRMGILEPAEAREHLVGERCADRDCDLFGFIHPPPCVLMPTMPAACYTDDRAPVTGMTAPLGPAGPPEPARAALEISDSQTMRIIDWETLAITEQIKRLEAGRND